MHAERQEKLCEGTKQATEPDSDMTEELGLLGEKNDMPHQVTC